MRQNESSGHRTQLSNEVMQIDFHDFVHMSVWMDDVELADEFHIGRKEVEVLRRKMGRS